MSILFVFHCVFRFCLFGVNCEGHYVLLSLLHHFLLLVSFQSVVHVASAFHHWPLQDLKSEWTTQRKTSGTEKHGQVWDGRGEEGGGCEIEKGKHTDCTSFFPVGTPPKKTFPCVPFPNVFAILFSIRGIVSMLLLVRCPFRGVILEGLEGLGAPGLSCGSLNLVRL